MRQRKSGKCRIRSRKIESCPTNRARRLRWIHFIPNTFGIDLSTSQTEVDTNDGIKHFAQPAAGSSTFDKALYYVSAIDITRQNPPRKLGSSRFRFQIVPNLFVINQHLSFPDFTEISSTTFHYVQASAGLGAEVGWQLRMHYAYFNLIPMYGFQYVSWTQAGVDRSLALGGFGLRSELGYRYYFSRHWSSRIFVKTTNSYTDLWGSVIHDIAPQAKAIESALDSSAGLAFSYTFDLSPDLKNQLKER